MARHVRELADIAEEILAKSGKVLAKVEVTIAAACELVEFAWKIKGRDPRELRLQRTVEHLQRKLR